MKMIVDDAPADCLAQFKRSTPESIASRCFRRSAYPGLWMWLVAVLIGFSAVAQLKAQLVTIDMVAVGNAGNAHADATNASHGQTAAYGYGGVGYDYQIGRTEVTLNQYSTFLNAVAASDPYGLYNTQMADNANVAGITRSGTSGS